MSPPRRSRRCGRSGAFSGVGSRPLGGNRSSARCGLCSLAPVGVEDVLEVAALEDEDAVEAAGAERSYPAFGVGVRVWRLDRCPDHSNALGAEDLVEGVRVFRVAVADEEPEGCSSPSCMTRLRACWVTQRPSGFAVAAMHSIRRVASEMKATVDPLEKRRLDCEEVAGKHARRLRAGTRATTDGSAPVPEGDLLQGAPSAPRWLRQ